MTDSFDETFETYDKHGEKDSTVSRKRAYEEENDSNEKQSRARDSKRTYGKGKHIL